MGDKRKVISIQEFSEHPVESFEQVLYGEEIIVQRGENEAIKTLGSRGR